VASGSLAWVIKDDPQELARDAANALLDAINGLPAPQLLLATGKTPIALYAELVRRRSEVGDLWQRSTLWALDEYLGLPDGHPQSFLERLTQMLGGPLEVPQGRLLTPHGMALDPDAEATRYEKALSEAGYADVAVLGVGSNGHLAFNEPGTVFSLGSHHSELAPETRLANSSDFGGNLAAVPKSGITVGIATILRSRTILLVAEGLTKAPSLATLREGVVTPTWPITALLTHPDVRVFADHAAAGD